MIPYILTALGGYLIGSSVKQYASGGQVLAPNGKPSNLTPEQYRLVRTPEFKAWFGDWENDSENASKVVDENGEPLVVYHSTLKDFNVFDTYFDNGTYHGKGAYFTSSKKDLFKNYNTTIKDKYKHCFLSIKNPVVVGKKNESTWFERNQREIIKNILRHFSFPRINYAYEKSWDSENLEKIVRSEFDEDRSGRALNKIYRDLGYDGIIFLAPNKLKGHTAPLKTKHFVAFQPSEIKLADGNTTFDGSNPDIRYAEGGQLVSNDYNRGYSRNPDVNKGGYVIFYEYEDDNNRKKVESFWNDLHRQKIAKELRIYKRNYRIYEDKIIALSSLYYTNDKSVKFTDDEISLIKELLNKYNLDFIKDYSLYENQIIINFADGFRLKKKESLFHDEKGEYGGYPYFYENLKVEDGKKYIGKMFKEVFGRNVDVPFSYKIEIRRYNNVLKRLAENNYSTEGRRKLDLSKAKQIEKYLDKYRYLAGFKLDSTGYIIAYEPFQE